MLEVRIDHRSRDVRLALTVDDGERVAVMGPNGAGKSTLLETVAGLLHPDEGRVVLDDRVLTDTDVHRRHHVPPHRRGIGLLAQEPALFRHLNVLDNVAFGPRAQGVGTRPARADARAWLDAVDATHLADRPARRLSGGEAGRVAVARALASRPRLLLLDEPMSALDVNAAAHMRVVLRRVLAGRGTLLVTHDLLDAMALADTLVVVEDGRISEAGPVAEVLADPRSRFAAHLGGLNAVTGAVEGNGVRSRDGQRIDGLGAERLCDGTDAIAVFPPCAVAVYREAPHGSPRNVVRATVAEVIPQEGRARIRADGLAADVTWDAVTDLGLAPGVAVDLVVKATEVAIHPL